MSRFAIQHRSAAARPFVRHPAQFELFDLVVPQTTVNSMQIPPWRGLSAWHHELDRQSTIMPTASP